MIVTKVYLFLQDKGGEGAKELEEFHSDRMKVVQLDVCSEEQVNQAVVYIKDNLEDSERGKQQYCMSTCLRKKTDQHLLIQDPNPL